MKKHFLTIIGACAFVAGGLLAREKALEAVDKLEEILDRGMPKAQPDEK